MGFAVTRSQASLTPFERFWTEVLDSVLQHHHDMMEGSVRNEGMSFERLVLIPPVELHRPSGSMPKVFWRRVVAQQLT